MENIYPFNKKAGIALHEGSICVLRTELGYYCGYVAFKEKYVPHELRGQYEKGIDLLSVHGGVTYASNNEGFCVYGFDCAHYGDSDRAELSNVDHLKTLCLQMESQLKDFFTAWPYFEGASYDDRIKILESIRESADIDTEISPFAILNASFNGI